LLLVVARAMGALSAEGLRAMAQRRVLLRSGLDALGTFTYLTSLFHLPIGNATAINMATPLFITLFAVIAVQRTRGRRALAGGGLGFCRCAADRAAQRNRLQRLCAAVPGGHDLFHAARDLSTRTIAASTPSILITLATALAVLMPWPRC
jgi:hypothetical protein